MSDVPLATFVPAYVSARWTRGFLAAIVILSVVAVVSGAMELALLIRASSGGISEAEAAASDSRQQLLGALQLLLRLGTAIAFLSWVQRVHMNLPSLGGRDLEFTPGWAVGWYFIPFLNLYRPLQAMSEACTEAIRSAWNATSRRTVRPRAATSKRQGSSAGGGACSSCPAC